MFPRIEIKACVKNAKAVVLFKETKRRGTLNCKVVGVRFLIIKNDNNFKEDNKKLSHTNQNSNSLLNINNLTL